MWRGHFLIASGMFHFLWLSSSSTRGQNMAHFSPAYLLKYYKMILVCICFVNIEDLFLGPPQPVNPPRPCKHSERRRRSQRLATLPMPDDSLEKLPSSSSATDGKVFSLSSQNQQESSVPEGNVYWFPIEPNVKEDKYLTIIVWTLSFLLNVSWT